MLVVYKSQMLNFKIEIGYPSDLGMKSYKAGRISYQAIEAARHIISREFQINGQIWVRIFADILITSRPTEIRMG
jgi:ribosomal protein L16/L10AE